MEQTYGHETALAAWQFPSPPSFGPIPCNLYSHSTLIPTLFIGGSYKTLFKFLKLEMQKSAPFLLSKSYVLLLQDIRQFQQIRVLCCLSHFLQVLPKCLFVHNFSKNKHDPQTSDGSLPLGREATPPFLMMKFSIFFSPPSFIYLLQLPHVNC